MSHYNKLSKTVCSGFLDFVVNHPPAEFSVSMRHLLFDYIEREIDCGFRLEFKKLIWSLNDLFDLLTLAENDMKKQTTIPIAKSKRRKKMKK